MRWISWSCALCLLPLATLPVTAQADRPELDCNEMVAEAITALESRDFEAFCRLRGEEPSEGDAAEFAASLACFEEAGELAPMLERLRLFPEIGKIPAWVDEVELEIQFLDGENRIKMEVEFEFEDGSWTLDDLEAIDRGELDEGDQQHYATRLSPAPSPGEKTAEAGVTELLKKFASALEKQDLAALRECAEDLEEAPDEELLKLVDSLHMQAAGHLFEMLQYPSIGPIPAPAMEVEIRLEGELDGGEALSEVELEWRNGKIVIDDLDLKVEGKGD